MKADIFEIPAGHPEPRRKLRFLRPTELLVDCGVLTFGSLTEVSFERDEEVLADRIEDHRDQWYVVFDTGGKTYVAKEDIEIVPLSET